MSKQLEDALNFDPLAAAEALTGANYKDSEATAWLGFALMNDHREWKHSLLAANNDTNSWRQSLAEWIAVVEDLGFALLSCEDVVGTGDKLRLWWHPDGVLLKSDSCGKDTVVNSASAYFNYRGPREAMFHCSSGHAATVDDVDVWEGSVDAREGLRFVLDKMRAAGSLLNPWIKRPFLWLLDYQEPKAEGYSYAAITEARIAKMPAHVRAAISP